MKILLKILKWRVILSAAAAYALPLFILAHEADTPHEETEDVAAISPAVLVIGIAIAIGIGGAVWFFMKKGKKPSTQQTSNQNTSDSQKQ